MSALAAGLFAWLCASTATTRPSPNGWLVSHFTYSSPTASSLQAGARTHPCTLPRVANRAVCPSPSSRHKRALRPAVSKAHSTGRPSAFPASAGEETQGCHVTGRARAGGGGPGRRKAAFEFRSVRRPGRAPGAGLRVGVCDADRPP